MCTCSIIINQLAYCTVKLSECTVHTVVIVWLYATDISCGSIIDRRARVSHGLCESIMSRSWLAQSYVDFCSCFCDSGTGSKCDVRRWRCRHWQCWRTGQNCRRSNSRGLAVGHVSLATVISWNFWGWSSVLRNGETVGWTRLIGLAGTMRSDVLSTTCLIGNWTSSGSRRRGCRHRHRRWCCVCAETANWRSRQSVARFGDTKLRCHDTRRTGCRRCCRRECPGPGGCRRRAAAT